MTKIRFFILLISALVMSACHAQQTPDTEKNILTGAEQTSLYLPLLEGKKIGIVANQTSVIGEVHLVDTLLDLGVELVRIFGPEHGFRELAPAGAHIDDSYDTASGLAIVSLYGKNRKPPISSMHGIDMMIFDIQDVGCRFYTYISTLQYVMEVCAELQIPLLVFDRPNPNISYVDGPVLEPQYRSFVGLNNIPVVYGLTIGEYARMINEEGWLEGGLKCDLKVIALKNYSRSSDYELPILPSSNLPNRQSVKLYPSLCLFEGTSVSVGRGTDFPFQVAGIPDKSCGDFQFTPRSVQAALEPKHMDETCYGIDLRNYNRDVSSEFRQFELKWLLHFYHCAADKEQFFNNYFEKLSGSSKLRSQIMQNVSEQEIRQSWKPAIDEYLLIRDKYLLYE